MAYQRYGTAKRNGTKPSYYIVQNYHYNGGKQLERQTTNYKEAMGWASETPKAYIGAYDDSGGLIGDYHQSPGAVPLNKRQLAKRAREKAGHSHNRSGGRVDHAWPPGEYLGHSFYKITDRLAGQLAKASRSKLPKPGYELTVALADGRLARLIRTPLKHDQMNPYGFLIKAHKRGWVWALHGIDGYNHAR